MGTLSLLQAAKVYWESLPEGFEGKRFYHISTDEVYGALELTHPEGIEPRHALLEHQISDHEGNNWHRGYYHRADRGRPRLLDSVCLGKEIDQRLAERQHQETQEVFLVYALELARQQIEAQKDNRRKGYPHENEERDRDAQ